MIKAVIFDIDNTMYDFDKAEAAAMQALDVYWERELALPAAVLRAKLPDAMALMNSRTGSDQAASHNHLLRFQALFELLGLRDHAKVMTMSEIYWEQFIAAITPEPGLLALAEDLAGRGIALGVGTDMTAYVQYRKLQKLGILPYLSWLVTSEEAGIEKPDPRFFGLCVEKAGCRPDECVFIGDHLQKDVIGAAAGGLHSRWYRPLGETGDHPAIRSFTDCRKGKMIDFGAGLMVY